jgi:hypothetical protein
MTEPTVTQADREATENLWNVRTGKMDKSPVYIAQAFARHREQAHAAGLAEGVALGVEAAANEQPSTAEDPNESAYQRGRFEGVIEYAKVIRDLDPAAIIAAQSNPAPLSTA